MGRDYMPRVKSSDALVGVIVVPDAYDERTPIGGLAPLVRHALSLQAAGVGSVHIRGPEALAPPHHPKLHIPVVMGASEDVTAGLDEASDTERGAIVIPADVSPHRDVPRALAQRWGRDTAERTETRWFSDEGAHAALALAPWHQVEDVVGLMSDAGADDRPMAALPPDLFVVSARDASERRAATGRHLESLSKSTTGIIDRKLMRPFTQHVTRVLCRTPITPNMVTLVSIGLALLAAYWVSLDDRTLAIWAGALLVLVQFIDCLDGELARMRYQGSRFGAWLDTLGDGAGIFAFIVGVLVHELRVNPEAPGTLWIGVAGLIGWSFIQLFQAWGSLRTSGSGSVQAIAWGHHREGSKTVSERWIARIELFAKIDAIRVLYATLVIVDAYRLLLIIHGVSACIGALYFGGQVLGRRISAVSET